MEAVARRAAAVAVVEAKAAAVAPFLFPRPTTLPLAILQAATRREGARRYCVNPIAPCRAASITGERCTAFTAPPSRCDASLISVFMMRIEGAMREPTPRATVPVTHP